MVSPESIYDTLYIVVVSWNQIKQEVAAETIEMDEWKNGCIRNDWYVEECKLKGKTMPD